MTDKPRLVEAPGVRQMSEVERSEAKMRTAMQSPAKLKEWLDASGRSWLVFNAGHFVDSMDHIAFDEKCEQFQTMIANYRDHRAGLQHHTVPDPRDPSGKTMMDVGYPETLTIDELDRAIRYLIGQASEMDPTWKLENDPR